MKPASVPPNLPGSTDSPLLFRDDLTRRAADSARLVAEPPPVVAAGDVLRSDDVLDFGQPEDELRIGDVLPTLDVPSLDLVTERAEFDSCVRTAFAALPRAWRHVLELRFVDDLGSAEVARRTGVMEEDIPSVVEHARALLRAHLEESGYRFHP